MAGALLTAGIDVPSVEEQVADFDKRLIAEAELSEDHELREILGVL